MKNSIIFLFTFLIACGQQSGDMVYRHAQKAEIKQALVEMLKQSTDPFLIVEDPKTENFIQFYNEDGRILIDLPEGALAPDEVGVAKGHFEKHGIPLKETQGTDPETGKTFVNKSWTNTYAPEQTDKVVNIALGALLEIYGISSTARLKLTKGWE